MKLSAQRSTTAMIATIHALKTKAKLDDDSYRDLLERQTGKRSAKALSVTQAGQVIERLRELAGDRTPVGAVARLDGPVGAKLRALWIAAYDLGVVRDRTDRAMLSYLERQTGVSHVRFLSNAGAGNAAIEGIKAWLARASKIEWPGDRADIRTSKRAVLHAQWLRLIDLGAVIPTIADQPLSDLDHYAWRVACRTGWDDFEPCHFDQVQAALGRRLRAAVALHSEGAVS
ncbi:regulatory protein GemA [Rhodopseudomonas palustris]|uniref:Regulatory protein GemA n=1 Tax=Rhodopseudomonas palustris TaxID=1076 RepID=A0A418V4C0_RHOPL|nr:regulatory protein GemA [Rhodopseudomonas palustris]RJF70895.1 regulatory protein GemA [Rhodopseudomonas palustris]